MTTAALRHLARLLGLPATAPPIPDTLAAAAADPQRVAAALADEALASDDVTSAAAARAFVEERLAEWSDLLDAELRQTIAAAAFALIERRAPDA